MASPDFEHGLRKRSLVVSPAILVGLLFAGYFKENPYLQGLPIDLTFLMLGLVLVAIISHLLTNPRLHKSTIRILVLFAFFVPPIAWSSSSEYGSSKIVRLFAVTLICALAGSLLVTSAEKFVWFLRSTVAVGFALAILIRISPTSVNVYGRLAADGSNTIAAGRATGAAITALLGLWLLGRCRWWLAVGGAILLLPTLIGSGSRGPLLAVGAAVLMAAWTRSKQHRLRNTLGLGILFAGVGMWALSGSNLAARDRILLLFADDQGTSIGTRSWLYQVSWDSIVRRPQGLGWGGFEPVFSPIVDYPHNLFLEVFGEAGWLPGMALVAVCILAIASARKQPAVLITFAFWFINVLVSGDVNDNRTFFATLGIALAVARWTPLRQSASRIRNERHDSRKQLAARRHIKARTTYITTMAAE